MAHVLDLEVFPRDEHQLAALVIAADIAGSVDQFRPSFLKRVDRKCFRGLFRIIHVAERQGCAADADLALFAALLRDLVILIVEKNDIRVVERASDRDRFAIFEVPIHSVVAAHAGSFRRTVQVRKSGLRKCGPPHAELLQREYLRAKCDGL